MAACTKGGLSGDNTLVVYPFHNSKPIDNAVIYIKYRAKRFPGEDVDVYDDHQIAATFNNKKNPSVTFSGLERGQYYLYGIGYDSSIEYTVLGGMPFEITKESGQTEIILPIKEPWLWYTKYTCLPIISISSEKINNEPICF